MRHKIDKVRLLLPSPEMVNRAMEFRAEYLKAGEIKINGSRALHDFGNFREWLKAVKNTEATDEIPSSTFFLVRVSDGFIIGICNIRHQTDERQIPEGHVGYSVRPTMRKKGYGTELLRLALIKAESLGVIEAVVSCKKTNAASKRVIEKNGLRFEREFVYEDGETVLMYKKAF